MNAYQTAYELACENLKARDIDDICLHTNAVRIPEIPGSVSLKYMECDYIIDLGSGNVRLVNSEKQVTTTVKVLLLHYLLNARICPLTGKLISFKEIPGGGSIYYQTFHKRAITPLVKTFATNPEKLYKAAEQFNGIKENYGDASVTIRVFPLIPVTYVIWQGDEEFPASGTILFDETVTNFLPGEDIVLAASFGTYALMEQLKKI
jgi:hypothetical protein